MSSHNQSKCVAKYMINGVNRMEAGRRLRKLQHLGSLVQQEVVGGSVCHELIVCA